MKTTLSIHEIADRLFSDENAGWSRAGSLALAEWLEQMEEDTESILECYTTGAKNKFGKIERKIEKL